MREPIGARLNSIHSSIIFDHFARGGLGVKHHAYFPDPGPVAFQR
jgi:hypothetical protein